MTNAEERHCLSDLAALKVLLAHLEAQLLVFIAERLDVDPNLWPAVKQNVSAGLLKIKRANVLACRLSQTLMQ
jgi:hypothetical protein